MPPKQANETKIAMHNAEQFLEEAKTDLEKASLLKDKPNLRRRRLFFLQQSSEKATKSMFALFEQFIVMLPFLPSMTQIFQKKNPDILSDRPFEILSLRLGKIMGSYADPRRMGHNPVSRLKIKEILQDIYLYLRLTNSEKYVADIAQLIDALEEIDLKVILTMISQSHYDFEIKEMVNKLVSFLVASRGTKLTEEDFLKFFSEFIIPIGFRSFVVVSLDLALLNFLSEYEQSSRYPDSDSSIPNNVLESLDDIQQAVESLVESSKFFLKEKYFSSDSFAQYRSLVSKLKSDSQA